MSKLNINRLTNENEDGAPSVSGIATFSSTAFLVPPSGTTAQRPENVSPGMIRFNTDSGHLEYYNGVEWTEVLVANNTLDGGNRGIFSGGNSPAPTTNVLDFVTISTLGNALDFGDLTRNVIAPASCASPTRVLLAGGLASPLGTSKIDAITIASTGNAVNFGNLTRFGYSLTSLSSSIRGIFAGGNPSTGPNVDVNTIDYVTIASFGDAIDFGDLTVARGQYSNSTSNNTRGVFGGGYRFSGPKTNTLDYITISSRGDAIDFGDSTVPDWSHCGLSDSHGGLGGF